MADLTTKARTLVEGQIRLEEQCIGKYRRHSSQAGDPALSGMLNIFINDHKGNVDALRQMLGGRQTVDANAFEGQVYGGQVGGTNPGGYRDGGLAGTETVGGARVSPDVDAVNREFRERPAGDNVGWQASQLNEDTHGGRGGPGGPAGQAGHADHAGQVDRAGQAGASDRHLDNYGQGVTVPPGSYQATGLARGEQTSGGYQTHAFEIGNFDSPVEQAPGSQVRAGAVTPGRAGPPSAGGMPPSADDPIIVDDVIETEHQVDAGYRAIEAEVEDAGAREAVREMRGRVRGRSREAEVRKANTTAH